MWTRLTSNVAVVEAITWSRTGAFSTIMQLSSSSHGAFLPCLAVNKAGTAIVVWQAAGLLDNSYPYQVESVTRLPGGAWSTVTTVSPVVSQTWTPRAALDAAGNSTVIWEQGAAVDNYRIYAAACSADGIWSSPVKIEQTAWYYAGSVAIASDDAGNITTAWVAEDSTGSSRIRSALKPAGSPWQLAVTVGPATTIVNLVSVPKVAASSGGSLTVIGWASYGSANTPNVATRVKGGTWPYRTAPRYFNGERLPISAAGTEIQIAKINKTRRGRGFLPLSCAC